VCKVLLCRQASRLFDADLIGAYASIQYSHLKYPKPIETHIALQYVCHVNRQFFCWKVGYTCLGTNSAPLVRERRCEWACAKTRIPGGCTHSFADFPRNLGKSWKSIDFGGRSMKKHRFPGVPKFSYEIWEVQGTLPRDVCVGTGGSDATRCGILHGSSFLVRLSILYVVREILSFQMRFLLSFRLLDTTTNPD